MKLLLLCVSLLLPCLSFAQKIQLAINAGATINNNPASSAFVLRGKFGNISWYGNVKGFIVLKKWQFGSGAEVMNLTGKIAGIKSNNSPYADAVSKVWMAKPALVPHFIVNYKVGIGNNNYMYIGLQGGYMYTFNAKEKLPSYNSGSKGNLYLDAGGGFVYGSQIGITHSFGKSISMNMELGIRIADIHTTVSYKEYTRINGTTGPSYQSTTYTSNYVQKDIDYSLMYFPLSIGIRYKL